MDQIKLLERIAEALEKLVITFAGRPENDHTEGSLQRIAYALEDIANSTEISEL
jgi:hypothetical protein